MAEKNTDTNNQATGSDGAKKPDSATMHVKIYAPFHVYFEGEATSVSAENATGPFDILPRHHNFMCMLIPCTIRVVTLKGVREIPINRALMHVKADKVVVFVDV